MSLRGADKITGWDFVVVVIGDRDKLEAFLLICGNYGFKFAEGNLEGGKGAPVKLQ